MEAADVDGSSPEGLRWAAFRGDRSSPGNKEIGQGKWKGQRKRHFENPEGTKREGTHRLVFEKRRRHFMLLEAECGLHLLRPGETEESRVLKPRSKFILKD